MYGVYIYLAHIGLVYMHYVERALVMSFHTPKTVSTPSNHVCGILHSSEGRTGEGTHIHTTSSMQNIVAHIFRMVDSGGGFSSLLAT